MRQTANRVVNEAVRIGALEASRGTLRVLDRELLEARGSLEGR